MDSLFAEPPPVDAKHTPTSSEDSPPAAQGPVDDAAFVLRADVRHVIPLSSGKRWERLTPQPEADAEFIEVVYAPNTGQPNQADFVQHKGREFGVIIQGSLTVEVGFDRTVLHVGDSIAFDSHRPHRFWNATSEEVRAVWFILDDHRSGESSDTRDAAARNSLERSAQSHGQ